MKLKQTLKFVCHISLLGVIIILIASGIVVMTHYAYDIDSVYFGSFVLLKFFTNHFQQKLLRRKQKCRLWYVNRILQH